jgi:hypothetical protein
MSYGGAGSRKMNERQALSEYVHVRRQRILTHKQTLTRLNVDGTTLDCWCECGLICPYPGGFGAKPRFFERDVDRLLNNPAVIAMRGRALRPF